MRRVKYDKESHYHDYPGVWFVSYDDEKIGKYLVRAWKAMCWMEVNGVGVIASTLKWQFKTEWEARRWAAKSNSKQGVRVVYPNKVSRWDVYTKKRAKP